MWKKWWLGCIAAQGYRTSQVRISIIVLCVLFFCAVLLPYCTVKRYVPCPCDIFHCLCARVQAVVACPRPYGGISVPVAIALPPVLSLRLWKCRPASRLPMAVRYDYELGRLLNSINLTPLNTAQFSSVQFSAQLLRCITFRTRPNLFAAMCWRRKLYSAICGKARGMNIIDCVGRLNGIEGARR